MPSSLAYFPRITLFFTCAKMSNGYGAIPMSWSHVHSNIPLLTSYTTALLPWLALHSLLQTDVGDQTQGHVPTLQPKPSSSYSSNPRKPSLRSLMSAPVL